jgi:hypothetical protein
MAFEIVAYSTQVGVKFKFIRRMNDWSAVFGAEDDMYVILY